MAGSKKPSVLVVGEWQYMALLERAVFVPDLMQPEDPLTEIRQIVEWTKEHHGDETEPTTFHFIREVPGKLELAMQAEFGFMESMGRADVVPDKVDLALSGGPGTEIPSE
tara:strand:+ start:4923 stop:5252 length:330 start_codon:yes stop_codon:yes gene_type:complete